MLKDSFYKVYSHVESRNIVNTSGILKHVNHPQVTIYRVSGKNVSCAESRYILSNLDNAASPINHCYINDDDNDEVNNLIHFQADQYGCNMSVLENETTVSDCAAASYSPVDHTLV